MKDSILKIIRNDTLNKTIKLFGISIISNSVGFLVPIYIAYKYPISKETDNFFLAYSVILFVSVIFSGALRSVSIPFLKEKLNDNNEYETFVNTILSYLKVWVSLLCMILAGCSYVIFLYNGDSIYQFLFFSVPIVFFTIINAFCYAILNSQDKFYVAELSPLTRGIVIILTVLLFNRYLGLMSIILGYNLGELFKFLHLYYYIRRETNIKLFHQIKDFPLIKDFIKQGSFQVIATTLASASPLIDRFVTSIFLVAGSISLLDYGDKIFMAFHLLLNSFLVLILSKWSSEYIGNEFNIKRLNMVLGVLTICLLMLVTITFLLKQSLVDFLYPKLSLENREIIAFLIFLNMIGFLFNALNQVVNRATIVIKATNIMVSISGLKLVINLICDIIFVQIWGLIGLVIASIIVHLTGFIINYILITRKFKRHTTSIIGN